MRNVSQKRKSVTLQLLWYECKQANPDGVQHSQFCAYYRERVRKLDVVMRQIYRAREKMFADFADETVTIRDRASGEIKHAYAYVAVMGASNYAYAEATMAQDLRSWVNLTRNASQAIKDTCACSGRSEDCTARGHREPQHLRSHG